MKARAGTREEAAGKGRADYAETILLVEDEGVVREVTCEVLRSAGYTVLTAKNAVEAVRQYEACGGAVELLLTDVILPGESGHALATRLRQADPRLKVLLVTGYGREMDLGEVGKGECLAKPYSRGVLLREVRQRMDGGPA